MNNRKRAEGGAIAVVVLIVMVIVIAVSYDVGSGSAKTTTKTVSSVSTETTVVDQTITQLVRQPKTNLTAAFILYGTTPSIQYQFYGSNNTLLGSGTLDSNSTVLVFSQTIGKVVLTTAMPQCVCSAKISLSDNGTLIAVGYNTALSRNNLTGFA